MSIYIYIAHNTDVMYRYEYIYATMIGRVRPQSRLSEEQWKLRVYASII